LASGQDGLVNKQGERLHHARRVLGHS
jgi:hypothetical protein